MDYLAGMRTFGLEPQARCALIMVGVLTLSLFEAGESPKILQSVPNFIQLPPLKSLFAIRFKGRLWESVDVQIFSVSIEAI